jgi:hypothetical protein
LYITQNAVTGVLVVLAVIYLSLKQHTFITRLQNYVKIVDVKYNGKVIVCGDY